MRPSGIHHVSICVRDVGEAVAFYTEVLGLTIAARPDVLGDGAWLEANGGQVHLLPSPDAPRGGDHFALHVDDLDACLADLRAKGVDVATYPLIAPGVGHQAFLTDPSGNTIELNQPDRS